MDTIRFLLGILIVYVGAFSKLSTNATSYCGERYLMVEDDSRLLDSPGYPYHYDNNKDCTWTLSTFDDSKAVSVKVVNSTLETSPTCNDNVTAYDGPNISSRMIWSWCGTETPNITSSGRYLTLRLQTDISGTRSGFRLQYQAAAVTCGEQLSATTESQDLYSPVYRNIYQNNLNCTWTIRTRAPRIKLEVIASELGYQFSGCTNDNVKVYDGELNQLLGTICRHHTPTLISKSSVVRIVFVTNGIGQNKGVHIKYTGVYATCGGELSATAESQDLYSPGYPHIYQNNLNCTWTIRTRAPRIKLEVIASELGYQFGGCTNDNVKVYDGELNQLLGTICRHHTPTLISKSSVVRIVFVTNGIGQNKGVHIKYTGVYATCGGELSATTESQDLYSPGYPHIYQNHLDCKWSVTADIRYRIKMTALDTAIQLTVRCAADAVTVYDGSSIDSPVLGKFCGRQQPTYVSSNNVLIVAFKTDGSTVDTGFKLSFHTEEFDDNVSRTCGPTSLTALDPTLLTSPGYPSDYGNFVDCTWIINAEYPDFVVSVEVTTFDIEYQPYCAADFVQAFDGESTYDRSLGKWCGTELPQVEQSTGQYMLITFHSNGNTRKSGFQMQFSYKVKSTDFHDSSTVGLMIGGISGGCLLLFGIVCFASYRVRKNIRTQTSQHSNNARPTSTQQRTRRSIYLIGRANPATDMAPATFTGPPSYDEVMASAQGHQLEAPPPYSSVGAVIPTVSPVNVMSAGALADIPADSIVNEMPKDEEVTVQDDVDEPGVDASDTQPILLTENMSSDC